jgi:DNA-binding XRE family transcriptional regulator
LLAKEKLVLSQDNLAEELGVSRRCLRNWINENRLLPSTIFAKIINLVPALEDFSNEVIEKCPQNWGVIKGGQVRVNEMRKKGVLLIHLKNMLMEKRKRIKTKRIDIPSETIFSRQVIKDRVQTLPLLVTLLMTDGYVNPKGGIVGFTSTDFTMINIFTDFIKMNSEATPHILERKNGIFESYVYDRTLIKNLLFLSPTYKTAPKSQSINEYNKEPQPTILFLLQQDKKTQIYCVRLAMSADGCIIIQKESERPFRIRGRLFFSCAHKLLIKEWKTLFNQINLPLYLINRNDYWGGVSGIATTKKENIKKFMEYGGFADLIKTTKKSKRFAGYEKNSLLKIAIKEGGIKSWKEIYTLLKK